ncbi:hypothetical protein OHA77_13365 [Streptosporangium sp. NBC_01639]|uniref:hypothetical protein n=1 Tax=Streptosporangium sp. NBC_01639 TaxID=2975948 RepID=UPI003865BBB1|nr:hypothetical protein OHA77_13365 [Streptosporangium sp. NBC_01639]
MSRERLLRTLGIAATIVGLFIGLSPIPHNGDNTCGSAFIPDGYFQCPSEQSGRFLLAFIFLIPGLIMIIAGRRGKGKKDGAGSPAPGRTSVPGPVAPGMVAAWPEQWQPGDLVIDIRGRVFVRASGEDERFGRPWGYPRRDTLDISGRPVVPEGAVGEDEPTRPLTLLVRHGRPLPPFSPSGGGSG